MSNAAMSVTSLLWSNNPDGQVAIGILIVLALLVTVAIFLPLCLQLVRLLLTERQLGSMIGEPPVDRASLPLDDIEAVMLASPARTQYLEFARRWTTAQPAEGIDRAPVRLLDILDERPLMPFGPRRSLLPVLPGLFLTVGVFAALAALIPGLDGEALGALDDGARTAFVAGQIGIALRAAAWGFLCAIVASLAARLIEGSFTARSHRLDESLELAFGSISPGELAELTRQTQQTSLEALGRELTHYAGDLNERLDRGLQRIEQSTAHAANLVSQEQRGALHSVVQELSLSVRQGVEHHLSELRAALGRAVEHQSSVTGGLAEAFQRMVENAESQDRVARILGESASSVEQAARAMQGSSAEMQPVLENLSETSRTLSQTAERMGETQQVVARSAEGVRSSLEHAASGVDDQRQFIEMSLGEIRRALVGLGDGIGDSLQRSLREVDDVLGTTVGRLRDTLAESNETIDRLAGPVRAAEGTSRETHLALDRVRGEVEALGEWLNQAMKPLRAGLSDVDGRAEDIARALGEFTGQTRQVDRTMDSLRQEIHEESRRLQSAGSDLGRRLKLASDAVGLLESATSEAARRARPDFQATTSVPEHGRSSLPGDPEVEQSMTPSPFATGRTPTLAPSPKQNHAPVADDHATTTTTTTTPNPEDEDATDRESNGSGYRVGAPRAQGPDPYRRFERETGAPSNLRHFPTRDRELGGTLRLSGLLGPSGASAPGEADAAEPDASDAETDESRDATRASDEQD